MPFFDSVVDCSSDKILCFYSNITSQIQIVQITNIPSLHLEQVVFPGEELMFAAVAEAKLAVHTSEITTATLTQIIPCQRLRITKRLTSIKSDS